MRHVFTLLAFALMSSGLAQVPDGIPEGGIGISEGLSIRCIQDAE